MKIKHLTLASLPVLLMAACSQNKTASDVKQRTVFFDKAGMDTTISPGDNFFLYANGAWLKNTVIPASESAWGSFYTLDDENRKDLHSILEQAAKDPDGADQKKVGDFYASGMDTATLDKRGFEPVKPMLAKIDAIKDAKELVNYSADSFKDGDGYLFGLSVDQDQKLSTKHAVYLSQAATGLPSREYYFSTKPEDQKVRTEYLKYIAALFKLSGIDSATAKKNADEILKLETEIAKSHRTPVELRDPIRNYNKYAVADFQKQVPFFDFKDLLKRMDASSDSVIVGQPEYYKALASLLQKTPLATWKNKLKFETLSGAAGALSAPFRKAKFDFYNKTLNGQQIEQERWKKMVNTTDRGLGELLGKIYVEKFFPAEAKERMLKLVNNLQKVYEERIRKLDWMSPETKKKAIEKLHAFTKKIGYTDKWKSYDDVSIDRSKFFENLQAIAVHDYKDRVSRLGKDVDKTEWFMTPPTVNAYYNPGFNEIVFPAGILRYPFFDYHADDAINYGAIGAVIGHEMTHGFDDQGRQYDKEGNLKDWWTKQDADKFNVKADAVSKLYDSFTVLNGLHVNGKLTLGENLADLGGVAIAYDAFKLTDQGKGSEKIDGFTPDQRFFLGYAQVWRIKDRDERLRMRVNTDPHSPEMFRVNGPLSNMEAFYRAFNVQPANKMYRAEADRVKVW